MKRELAQYGAPRQIVLPLADWRIPRVAMVAEKVLGADFMVTYLGVPSDSPDPTQEHLKFDMQGRFLEPMPRGDDAWLSGKFYDSWLYRFWAERG
ncbi:hypothetical protein [Allobranchiibius sp. GilTou73]|uniref:hypothetical protein n=1 Tax=Allobranchiibius sp. GilTou73 TaxID=2904523 RepID=UPI001F38F951|nr:hypothetical protein [Allobranchiibius sp. GilTou73]UIJ33755.1 hypothetical protein LVQ62_11390 [Allobranchiibius sp. GilTou73]